MAIDIDFRVDQDTAALVADALKLQAQYGFEFARRHLLAQGVEAQLAQRLLGIRYERRALAGRSALQGGPVTYGRG